MLGDLVNNGMEEEILVHQATETSATENGAWTLFPPKAKPYILCR